MHLLLFVCAVAMAGGTFGPLVGTLGARDVRFADLRDGFAPDRALDQIGSRSVTFTSSLEVVLLGAAIAVLLAAMIGSYSLAWLGVLSGLATLLALAWRLNERFDQQLSTQYRDLFSGAWGLYLFGGGLIVALLLLMMRQERRFP